MSGEFDKKHKIQELKEMVQERKHGESVETVLGVFCERNGLSMDSCRVYYDQLVKKGEIKKK